MRWSVVQEGKLGPNKGSVWFGLGRLGPNKGDLWGRMNTAAQWHAGFSDLADDLVFWVLLWQFCEYTSTLFLVPSSWRRQARLETLPCFHPVRADTTRMKSGLRLSYSKAERQKEVGENLFTENLLPIKATVSAPVRDPSQEAECAQNMWCLIKCGLFTHPPPPQYLSAFCRQQNMGAGQEQTKSAAHSAPVKGGGGEMKGRKGWKWPGAMRKRIIVWKYLLFPRTRRPNIYIAKKTLP